MYTARLEFMITTGIVAMCIVLFWRLRKGGERERTLSERAELTARTVLIGVVSITGLMVIFSFAQTGASAFPEMPEAYLVLNGIAITVYIVVQALGATQEAREHRQQVLELQRRSLENPDNVRYAWDLAAAKLEDYLNRNLSQVKWIFIVAILVMFSGFAFMLYGVTRTFTAVGLNPGIVSTGAGIITQFIGVTFMVIYRSTMEQASSYMMILERINNIGMAVQILEKMSDSTPELKNTTRAQIVKSLAELKITKQTTTAQPKAPQRRTKAVGAVE
jgi:Cyanobacterial TRADD-N associated 2-Transmembrane domain